MSEREIESAKIQSIKEMYDRMSLIELLAEENTVQRAYWRRIPSYFEDLMIIELHKAMDRKLP